MSEEAQGQPTHGVNPSNMLLTYKNKLITEIEGRILAETAVNELLEVNQSLRNQIQELQKAKEISDLQFKTELDELRSEVSSLHESS